MACDGFAAPVSPQNCQNPMVAAQWNTLVVRRPQGFLLAVGAYDFFNLTLTFFFSNRNIIARNPTACKIA